jgi:hypothetical protein
MTFWDVFSLAPNTNQLYPGAVVKAVDSLDMAACAINTGLFSMTAALTFWARAIFYRRLKKELWAADRDVKTDHPPESSPGLD